MALGIWTEQDIHSAIEAARLGIARNQRIESSHDLAYREGFESALDILATNFGISLGVRHAISEKKSVPITMLTATISEYEPTKRTRDTLEDPSA